MAAAVAHRVAVERLVNTLESRFQSRTALARISINQSRAAAYGRKQPLKTAVSLQSERPLSGKADIQYLSLENLLTNVRFTPGSGH